MTRPGAERDAAGRVTAGEAGSGGSATEWSAPVRAGAAPAAAPGATAGKAVERVEAARILAHFQAAGAVPVEADILQPAGTLLDLYGEDIRARAYVTHDPLRGEMMLRPDFTVPVVEMHMSGGAEPARYAYAGEVFRRQEEDVGRPSEYIQVGYEVFARDDPAAADAEVFALFADLLAARGMTAATGDIGILTAAVTGLATSPARKAALMRHIWRPRRFRALIARYAAGPDPARARLLERVAAEGPEAAIAAAGALIGRRGADEIAARLRALADDAAEPPLGPETAGVLDDLLSLAAPAAEALEHLRDVTVDLPEIAPAVTRMARRLDALAGRGVAVDALPFAVAHGRTTMEYYDGFVFAFSVPGRADLPPVATGGRYDALTARLGRGKAIPAVGGVVRPGLLGGVDR